jgi:MFS family permease
MSKQHNRNEPLGLRNAPARNSASSLPSPYGASTEDLPQTPVHSPGARHEASRPTSSRSIRPSLARRFSSLSARSHRSEELEKKKTEDGKIILEPQPDDSLNDPLNWPALRRDLALLSLGFYCMLGGGMTPVLAAGFTDVAETYGVSVPTVALSTGFYMAGMGLGSVIASPTAILFGKRPVYLGGAILLILSSVWCALSPTYISLVIARVVQGMAISPVECLPSATIAEIFFLHERAYRLGIYTLLLLGGKNLIPLVSAAIIGSLGWRWVFWIVTIIAGFCLTLLFFFVPETFWDRTPRPKVYAKKNKHHLGSLSHIFHHKKSAAPSLRDEPGASEPINSGTITEAVTPKKPKAKHHVGFVDQNEPSAHDMGAAKREDMVTASADHPGAEPSVSNEKQTMQHQEVDRIEPSDRQSTISTLNEAGSPGMVAGPSEKAFHLDPEAQMPADLSMDMALHSPRRASSGLSTPTASIHHPTYTSHLQQAPPKTYRDTLQIWHGRLRKDNWFKVAIRPFILFAYPSILWSTLVYSLSVGWLIVLSESVSEIYREKSYHFTALQTGLVYLSPFIGGVLGTAVAGKLSDVIVRFMSRRNDGVYEPEFRLVMAIPVMLSTVIGLMGFGWSAEERDNFMVPTVFFGIISFGCTLGSTTAITFAVDSYRQYAGEALVTLNFSKSEKHTPRPSGTIILT